MRAPKYKTNTDMLRKQKQEVFSREQEHGQRKNGRCRSDPETHRAFRRARDRTGQAEQRGKPQASPPGSLPWLLGQTELKI